MAQDVYNAVLVHREDITPDLAIFRLRHDAGPLDFVAGQFATIGLLSTTLRIDPSEPDEFAGRPEKLIRRAYSIASSSREKDYVELYLKLVRSGALTSRLWLLRPGDRLWMSTRAAGRFTLEQVPADKALLMVATGTGLAPYIAMIRNHAAIERRVAGVNPRMTQIIGGARTDSHTSGDRADPQTGGTPRQFIVVHGARHSWDLGYRAELESLARLESTQSTVGGPHRALIYIPTITQPESTWAGHVGRVQTVLMDGTLEREAGCPVTPERFVAFLCGNPEMIKSMQSLLAERGFTPAARGRPGSLYTESYW